MEVDKRAENVAANMSYSGLLFKMAKQFEELVETYKSYDKGNLAFCYLESHFISVLAELYVYILAFTTYFTEKERKKWDEIVEYRLNLHEKFYDEREAGK